MNTRLTLWIVFLTAILLAPFALAESNAYQYSQPSKNHYRLEGFYGMASVNPSDLNSARENFIWNGVGPSAGTFSKMSYFGGSLGRRLGSHLLVSVRYEQQYDALPKTDVGSGMTVADYFVYNPILLLIEIPFEGKRWSFSFGGGAGYALNYEFHEQYSGTQEDITYQAHPFVFRGRVTLGFALGKHWTVFAEGQYEKVSANSLSTNRSYQATVNGVAIASGQTFNNASGNTSVKVDMSGFRYGLGLRFSF